MTLFLRLITLVVGLLFTCATSADAIIRTQAMLASTIAEYYVEDGEIRVELEIGLQDIQAFRNLMPDEIYQEMGHAPRPMIERVAEFFSRDLVIATASGPLSGRLMEIGPRARILRDPVTGEQLPVAEADEETVIAAVLAYALEGEPSSLSGDAPMLSNSAC